MSHDIRWEGYTHEEIYAAVHLGPGREISAAAEHLWAETQALITRIDERIVGAMAQSASGWEGAASDAARTAMSPLGQWALDAANDAGITAHAVTTQGEQARGLRNDMPEPNTAQWDAAIGEALNDPFYLFHGRDDMQAIEAEAANRAARAVDLMNGYTNNSSENRRNMDYWTFPPQVTVETTAPAAGGPGSPVTGLGSTAVSSAGGGPVGAGGPPPGVGPGAPGVPGVGAPGPAGVGPVAPVPVGGFPGGSVPGGSVPLGSGPGGSAPVGSAPRGTGPGGSGLVGSGSAGVPRGGPVGTGPGGAGPVGAGPSGTVPVGGAPVGAGQVVSGSGTRGPSASPGGMLGPSRPGGDTSSGSGATPPGPGGVRPVVPGPPPRGAPLPSWRDLVPGGSRGTWPGTDPDREVPPPGGSRTAVGEPSGRVPMGGERPGPGGAPTEPAARATGTRTGATGPAGLYPPMMAGAGGAGQERERRRPDYLVDDTDAFADDRWFTPPVIGADDALPRR